MISTTLFDPLSDVFFSMWRKDFKCESYPKSHCFSIHMNARPTISYLFTWNKTSMSDMVGNELQLAEDSLTLRQLLAVAALIGWDGVCIISESQATERWLRSNQLDWISISYLWYWDLLNHKIPSSRISATYLHLSHMQSPTSITHPRTPCIPPPSSSQPFSPS